MHQTRWCADLLLRESCAMHCGRVTGKLVHAGTVSPVLYWHCFGMAV